MNRGSMDSQMRVLEDARPSPTEEEAQMQQDRCLVLLARKNALDVAWILGLDA